MSGTNADIHFNLRLPEGLYEHLRQVAELHRRSINGQIQWLIEQYLEGNTGLPVERFIFGSDQG